nr:methionine--tRNA ligase [Bacillus marinisedimentorum]
MNIFIGGAWPYANGSLHIGHVASLLPGDILARYFRLKGEEVLYVSGSDCNGTPIAVRANEEGVPITEIAGRYHEEFVSCFNALGFTFDLYTRTDSVFHHQEVQNIFHALNEKGFLYKKEVEQTYCETCRQFLPDRYVEGGCPHCGNPARGDQCDYCSSLLEPQELENRSCKLCGSAPAGRTTEHFYFRLSAFQQELEEYLEQARKSGSWRANAIQMTNRYLVEGLRDRAATRDLENGVPVPVEGFSDKKIYVWIEAVSGYLTASKRWSEQSGRDWKPFWEEGSIAYYVHGKDNIPFHTIIWPAVLSGAGGLHLPDHIVSSEYVTIENQKLSTSRNWAVWVPDLLKRYHPDSIRYFLTINGPERRDADFSWREFIYSHNSELLGAYGNLVNRTLKFIEKSYGGEIPGGRLDEEIERLIKRLFKRSGEQIERADFKQALEEIFAFIRKGNKYFDEQKPWIQVREDPAGCTNTLYTSVVIIANLAVLLDPFLPLSAAEVRKQLGLRGVTWSMQTIENKTVDSVKPLFERIDLKVIDEETEKLGR